MKKLEGFQRKYLRGVAHGLKPVVFIGQKGLTRAVLLSAEKAFERHELIKVKFNDFKEKEEKTEISGRIERETGSENVGMIGHTAIFYRQQEDPEKRNRSTQNQLAYIGVDCSISGYLSKNLLDSSEMR